MAVVDWFTATVTDPAWDYFVQLDLIFSISQARYMTQRVAVGLNMEADLVIDEQGLRSRPRELTEVTSVVLRQVRVADVTRVAASAGIFTRLTDSGPVGSLLEVYGPSGEPKYPTEAFADRAHLERVAFSYQIARIAAQPPAKAVERQFGCSARTATNWIAKARSAGLIADLVEVDLG